MAATLSACGACGRCRCHVKCLWSLGEAAHVPFCCSTVALHLCWGSAEDYSSHTLKMCRVFSPFVLLVKLLPLCFSHCLPWPASLFTEFRKVRGNLKPDRLSSCLLCVLDLLIHLTRSKFKITRGKTHFLWSSGDISKDWCPFPGQVWPDSVLDAY